MQPLKKRSPKLIIVGVAGNFLCIANVMMISIFFHWYKVQEEYCYFNSGQYVEDVAQGNACMQSWYESPSIQAFSWLEWLSRHIYFSITAQLSILPYVLRSLRIRHMFNLRDKFCENQKFPKKSINNWSENRLIFYLLLFCGVKSVTDNIADRYATYRADFLYAIGALINSNGLLKN